ncbi:MAG: ABC transporter ATP-binding protein [Methylobacterium sp.]
MRLVWQASPWLTTLSGALRLVRALQPVAALFVAKLIVDEVVRLAGLADRPESLGDWIAAGLLDRIALLLLAEFALAVVADLLGRVVTFTESLLTERVSIVSSVRLMEHAATLDLQTFEDADFQNRLERARRQTSGRMTLLSQLFAQVQDLVTVASLAAGLLAYAPWLILLLALALVPGFLGEFHFNAESYRLAYATTPERRELDYVRQTAASVETAKEVRIFGLDDFLVARYRALSARFFADNRALALRRASWGALFTALGTIGYYAAYAAIVWRTVAGPFSVGDLSFLAGSFLRLRGLLEGLLASFSSTAGQALYLDDLFSFFAVRPGIAAPAAPVPVPRPIHGGFVFEDVGFRYPGSERWAVRHLSFTLRAGEVLALVGENGAGKTTLVKLLARLYDPTEGRILLDGRDLREHDPAALRAEIGVIFQDFVRYNMSAGENIAVGRIEAREDRTRIEAAAARSLADGVVARLPEGYEQMVGKRFTNGVELSGGEWQKIAIARAYMREAQVLILDEPTAALDARAEVEVFERFRDLSAGRTAVLISHRFSSVRMADRILVLADGRVEASGTHDDLVGRPGRYAELFALQAQGYR